MLCLWLILFSCPHYGCHWWVKKMGKCSLSEPQEMRERWQVWSQGGAITTEHFILWWTAEWCESGLSLGHRVVFGCVLLGTPSKQRGKKAHNTNHYFHCCLCPLTKMKPAKGRKQKMFGITEREIDGQTKQKCRYSDGQTDRSLWMSVQHSMCCLFVKDLCFIGCEIPFLELCTHPVHHSLYVGCFSLSTEQQTAAVILDVLTKPYCTNTELISSTRIPLLTRAQTGFVRPGTHSWRWLVCVWLWLAISVCANMCTVAYLCTAHVCVSVRVHLTLVRVSPSVCACPCIFLSLQVHVKYVFLFVAHVHVHLCVCIYMCVSQQLSVLH